MNHKDIILGEINQMQRHISQSSSVYVGRACVTTENGSVLAGAWEDKENGGDAYRRETALGVTCNIS